MVDEKEYMKKYALKNKTKLKEYKHQHYMKNKVKYNRNGKNYYRENKDRAKAVCKIYYLNNREKRIQMAKNYYILNRLSVNEYRKKRYSIKMATDINFKIKNSLRARVQDAIKNKSTKSDRTIELLGCSVEFLRGYLENKFKPGMSWSNYGSWHIDHIFPCAIFNMSDPVEQKQCFHYTNLQPLWAVDNWKKHDNVIYPEVQNVR